MHSLTKLFGPQFRRPPQGLHFCILKSAFLLFFRKTCRANRVPLSLVIQLITLAITLTNV